MLAPMCKRSCKMVSTVNLVLKYFVVSILLGVNYFTYFNAEWLETKNICSFFNAADDHPNWNTPR